MNTTAKGSKGNKTDHQQILRTSSAQQQIAITGSIANLMNPSKRLHPTPHPNPTLPPTLSTAIRDTKTNTTQRSPSSNAPATTWTRAVGMGTVGLDLLTVGPVTAYGGGGGGGDSSPIMNGSPSTNNNKNTETGITDSIAACTNSKVTTPSTNISPSTAYINNYFLAKHQISLSPTLQRTLLNAYPSLLPSDSSTEGPSMSAPLTKKASCGSSSSSRRSITSGSNGSIKPRKSILKKHVNGKEVGPESPARNVSFDGEMSKEAQPWVRL
jgi:hypothetical protein